ncbi:rubisco LSMT substrate-binding domain containing protein [Nitzschia inconspicua]|uniref:Rubisco LSMT substrate-binding domain containing protein n=1 Tax=Nitzschia inconspicua TaxID=303405 RepID=A0A9K3PHW0_9STRA|nr:rubisco LSMT substrate-binding domain containing protein [Nitzschia inconspicua]KAG7348267.1 rubisco LSMT substrate-binding domain containing protein [Nitzschia inconspicua]
MMNSNTASSNNGRKYAGTDRSHPDKYERFEEWLRENGAQFEMLELREYDSPKVQENDEAEEKKEQVTFSCHEQGEEESEMRGVHARTHLPPNSVCMAIPRRCLITVEMGQDTPIGQAILRSDLDLDAPKHIFLMIYLLWDRKVNGVNSFFHPYYEILPKTLSNMPIFWSQEELDYLKGSYLLQQIDDRNEAIAEDYYAICQIAPLAKICTLDEFKWARMCVCSRNFGLQIDGHRTSALVPHADMLNHYRPRETKWTFDEERQAFTITTLQSIPAGAQVYDSYGQKCNHRFLLNYGFAVEDNRELDGFCPNEVPLELSLSPDDPLFSQKSELWMRGEVHLSKITTKRVRVCVANNENHRLLLSLLRAMNASEEELQSLSSPVTSDMRSLFVPDHRALSPIYRSVRDIRHPLSLENERLAMLTLLHTVSSALAKYPTSLASDKEDLLDEQRYPPFSNKRHAKIQVRGEKEVLHHYARFARTALDVIDVIEQELKEEQQRGVEVQLGRGVLSEDTSRSCGYDYIARKMEEDEDVLHHTIVRYCVDVLGSLRKEEMRSLRRQRALPSTNTASPASMIRKCDPTGDSYC